MIHLHIFIREIKSTNQIEAEASREIGKNETKGEIEFANQLLAYLKKGLNKILEEEQKDPEDWWKNEDGEPPCRRN